MIAISFYQGLYLECFGTFILFFFGMYIIIETRKSFSENQLLHLHISYTFTSIYRSIDIYD